MTNNTFCKDWSISKNKSFEIQFDFAQPEISWFEFLVSFRTRCDHAGFSFNFEIFTLIALYITFYDGRHWNYDEDCWEIYPDKTNE